jgi:uncharacterized protein with von Willebrand factor type A (vWA) domain
MDSFDRDAFAQARRRLTRLTRTLERGGRLLPEFEALARDVFAILYKHNVVHNRVARAAPAAVFRRRILDWVLATPGLEATKATTHLDTVRTGLATAGVLEGVLEIVTNPGWLNRDDLLDQWRLQQLGDEAADVGEQLDALEALRDVTDPDRGETLEALDDLEGDLEERARELRREMEGIAQGQNRELDGLPVRAENLVKDAVGQASQRMSAAEEAANSYGSGLGMSRSHTDPLDKMTLGDHLLASEKLQKLAELVGLFRQVARSARQRVLERRPSELHSIDRGADLSHVLSSELVFLRHPVLRKEFLRRYADQLLVQYAIVADERAGRGPLVVCLDASGSMRGPRELWAKAIALTFLEIARRERRAFRAVVFSGHAEEARRFELLESALDRRLRKPTVDPELVVAFADYFPGGGTDFETPLSLAVESLQESRFKGGDIVLITDGQAAVSAPFLERLLHQKKALEFAIYAVLVDIEGGAMESLARFADETLRVSELTAESLRGVFRRV